VEDPLPRTVIDPGPFRFKDIHGPRRSFEELSEIARLLKLRGHRPVQCRFSLHRVPVRDLIESLIVEAHLDRGLRESGAFDYDAWRGAGAPEAPLRRLFTAIGDARRQESRGSCLGWLSLSASMRMARPWSRWSARTATSRSPLASRR